MKRYLLTIALLIGVAFSSVNLEAQNINVSINVGSQPAWGPIGYEYASYYYIPDINCYYDVNHRLFHYHDRGRWIVAEYLPDRYRNYDLYGLYKVVLNMNEPWRYNHMHCRDYSRYRGCRTQVVIRDSHDRCYHRSRENRVSWYYESRPHHGHNKHYHNEGRHHHRDDRYYRSENSRPRHNNSERRYDRNSTKNNSSYDESNYYYTAEQNNNNSNRGRGR